MRSGPGQRKSVGPANALRRAGYDGDLACQ